MSTSYAIDFGFEGRGAAWDAAAVVVIFASNTPRGSLETSSGPTAIADASRFIELYEMQVGVSPMDVGVYTEVVGGEDPAAAAVARSAAAESAGKTPVLVGADRRIAEDSGAGPLVALWGKLGRSEANEAALFAGRPTVLIGVRAATSSALTAATKNISIVTPKAFLTDRDTLKSMIDKIDTPVHLSIDLDVLAPGVVQNRRSVEPGGISWYDLMDLLEMICLGPGVSLVDITGTGEIVSRSPAASAGAQLILNLAGLIRAKQGL